MASSAIGNGLVLYHNLYNTHNTLEIPPHWIDYPWRPANNINDTGLPEPPPIEPGNHLHVANEVYDVTNPVRRALHRAFILHELDELGETRNLFFCLGAQFAGPLAFQEFFQDTVAEWEKKTGRTVRVQLATSKDITDAILADPVRAAAGGGDRHALLAVPAGRVAVGAAGREEPGVPRNDRQGFRKGGRRSREHDVRCRSTGRFANIMTGIRTRRSWRGMAARARSRY